MAQGQAGRCWYVLADGANAPIPWISTDLHLNKPSTGASGPSHRRHRTCSKKSHQTPLPQNHHCGLGRSLRLLRRGTRPQRHARSHHPPLKRWRNPSHQSRGLLPKLQQSQIFTSRIRVVQGSSLVLPSTGSPSTPLDCRASLRTFSC